VFKRELCVGIEVETSASVNGFSINFSGQCLLFSHDQNIQKKNHMSDYIFLANSKQYLKTVYVDEEIL
jgi:hypothetical protein